MMYSIRFSPIHPNGKVTWVTIKTSDQWLVIKHHWQNLLNSLKANKDKRNENYTAELIVEDYIYFKLKHYAKCKIYLDMCPRTKTTGKWYECVNLKSAFHYAHKYAKKGANVTIYNKFGKFVANVQAMHNKKFSLIPAPSKALILHPVHAKPEFSW